MSVTVITGRSGSGKSRFLMQHVGRLISNPFEKIIVIVPAQLTFETEKNIMAQCYVEGIFGLQVLSIRRLAQKILEDTGVGTFISGAQKVMICNKALQRRDEPYFGADKNADIDACTADLMTRLKSYNQTPGTLRQAAEKMTDAALSKKLLDTADVFEAYLDLCGDKHDLADMYQVAAGKADAADFLKGAHIVIDGLDSFCPAVMALVSKVIAHSKDTLAAFLAEGEGSDGELFASAKKDMARFVDAAKASGKRVDVQPLRTMEKRYACEELSILETNLYAYPYASHEAPVQSIAVFEADTIHREVDILASNILSEVNRGKRFCDIAVVAGGAERYAPVIKAKFALCGIPYFIDERRSLADNTFFDFLYKALMAAAGETGEVTGYIYSRFSPIGQDDQITLKKYARKYALNGWHYSKELWRGNDAATAERIRGDAMRPLQHMMGNMNEKSAKEKVEVILTFLKMCGAAQNLERFCARIMEADSRAEYEYFAQVYEKTLEVLVGIADVFDDMKLSALELAGLFKTGCEATKIAVIPPTTDEVAISDISVAQLPGIDVLFAIGVQDGVWPAKDEAAGILSSAERDMLGSSGFDIGVYDLAAEKLKVYRTLVKPKERLYLSYNTDSGQPSILIDRMRRIFSALVVHKDAHETASIKGMEASTLLHISGVLNGKEPDDSLLCICARLMQQPGWQDKAQRLLLRNNAALPIAQETAVSLYGGIRCSATRIENYYKCPYRHFMDYGIKAQQERDYVSDVLDIGTYMHLALDIFAQEMIGDGADIKMLSFGEVDTRMKAAAAKAAAEHDNAKLLEDERFALQYALLEGELLCTARRIKKHFGGTDARIAYSEQAFGDFSVRTAFGDVVISGKIDRVDVAGNYFRVVDYKSSATPFSLDDFAGGIALQLPVYIEAAQRLMDKTGTDMAAAGGYYMKIGDTYQGNADAVDKAARMAGISLEDVDVLSKFSAVSESGGFAVIDQAVTRSGALNGTGKKKYFNGQEMDALLLRANALIADAAEAIYRGNNAINPAVNMKKGDACAYCDYPSVCMFSSEYGGNEERLLAPFDKAQLTEGGNE